MKKNKILSKVLTFILICSLVSGMFIHTSALESDENEEYAGEYTEEVQNEVKEHVHEFGDWYVDEEAHLKIRECACGERETENIEDDTYFPEENIIVKTSTNIDNDVENLSEPNTVMTSPKSPMRTMGLTSTPQNTQSKIILNTEFVNFDGVATYTAYDNDNNKIAEKVVMNTSNVTMKVPGGQPASIVCTLSGVSLEGVTQSVTRVSGTFENAMYYLNVVITYVAPCQHANTREDVVEATYLSGGIKKVLCSDCGKTISEVTIPKLVCNHTNTEDIIVRDSTEKTTGTARVVCRDCGNLVRIKTIPKKEHTHTFETKTIASTCEQNGCVLNVCSDCGYTEVIRTLPTTDHEWGPGTVVTQPTCSSAGWTEYTCKNCSTVKRTSIAPLDHDFDVEITKQATCKDYGEKIYTCKICGKKLTDAIPKTSNHDWSGDYVSTKAPTCIERGEMTLSCTICGEVLDTKTTATISHKYEWVTTKEATEAEDGLKEYKCKTCGNVTNSEVIPKTGGCSHPFPRRKVQKVVPTCTQREIADIYCNECGELVQENVMYYTDPDNHPNIEEIILKEATYDEPGIKRYLCLDCGLELDTEIPQLVCYHRTTEIWNDPDTGKSYVKCITCGKILRESTCSHTGYGQEEVIVTQADATHWGEYQYVCKNCKKVMSTARVHPYSAYRLENRDGEMVTLYGWFDNEYAQEVFRLTNEYRVANGLNTLHYNTSTQDASNTRALEAGVFFSHDRPGGGRWNTVTSSWRYGGENLAGGQSSPSGAMTAWKNSEGHNRCLLYGKEPGQEPFKGLSVGCFHRFKFNNSYKPSVPTETIIWVQNFTFDEY